MLRIPFLFLLQFMNRRQRSSSPIPDRRKFLRQQGKLSSDRNRFRSLATEISAAISAVISISFESISSIILAPKDILHSFS